MNVDSSISQLNRVTKITCPAVWIRKRKLSGFDEIPSELNATTHSTSPWTLKYALDRL